MNSFRPEVWASLPDRLFSTRKYPQLQYFSITKCGSTFVKNLLWRIDHGADHSDALRIHRSNSEFPKAGELGFTMEQIRTMDYSFVVLRDPVDRFLSLYFDKVVGPGAARFIPLRRVLIDNHGLIAFPTDPDQHRKNCHILIRWLCRNLSAESELPQDMHWLPQSKRFRVIRSMNLKVLLLEDLVHGLGMLLEPLIPEISVLMAGIERNTAPQPVSPQAIMNDALRSEITALYDRDADVVRLIRAHKDKNQFATRREIPRFTDIR